MHYRGPVFRTMVKPVGKSLMPRLSEGEVTVKLADANGLVRPVVDQAEGWPALAAIEH